MKMTHFEELLGAELMAPGGGGRMVPTSSVVDGKKAVALYFSAHWCPPCRNFTPVLAEKYEALKAAGKELEIVFVSSDRDESAFADYFSNMPWYALPFSERDTKAKLSTMYGVRGIPALIVLSHDGLTITTEGRAAVSAKSFVEDFPYHPQRVNDLGDSTAGLNLLRR